MRCWAITVELGGREFEIPALPAADWWPVVSDPDLSRILDIVSSSNDLDEMLLSGQITAEELGNTLMEAIEEATGRAFHAVLVITHVANRQWSAVGGEMARAGFRWDVQPIGAALDLAFRSILACIPDKEAQDKFLGLLENEALTTGKVTTQGRERAMADFEAMAGPRPTAARATAGRSGSGLPRTPPPRPQPRPDDR